jgi:hypothetical protein
LRRTMMLRGPILMPLFLMNLSLWAQNAPPVTNLNCVYGSGQTFCTYMEPSADLNWSSYRYDLYESTTGPITTTAAASLVESGLLDNGGYLNSTAAYTQANRTLGTAFMSTTTPLGPMMEFGTGIAVRTTPSNRYVYYAVVTIDTRGILQPSSLVIGSNSLSIGVTESVERVRPILQMASTDPRTKTPLAQQVPSHTAGLPMWFYLHGSGGRMPATGDYWAFWGGPDMGINDGVQQVGRVYYSKTSFGQPVLYAAPQDRVWNDLGTGSLETYWNGFDWKGYIQPYTQLWLDTFLPFIVANYEADPNRVYGYGKSMGGLGISYWGIRQTSQPFAAVFAEVPVWWIEGNVTSMTQHKTIKATTELIAGSNVTYYNDEDSPVWVADCNNSAPPTIWASGRTDTSFPNHSMWSNAVAAANAMKSCHRAFVFGWNNGNHGSEVTTIATLLKQYQTIYKRNVSYPVFNSFSLDSNYGDGTYAAGDCNSGTISPVCYVNFGWAWTDPTDTSNTWAVTFSNDQLTTGGCPTLKCSTQGTVDVTAGNSQWFKPPIGTTVSWSTLLGQSGTAVVDQYGSVTVNGINVGLGQQMLTLTY